MKKNIYYRSFFVKYNGLWGIVSFLLVFFIHCTLTNKLFFSKESLLIFLDLWLGKLVLAGLVVQLALLFRVSDKAPLFSTLYYTFNLLAIITGVAELKFPLILIFLCVLYLVVSIYFLYGLGFDLKSSYYGQELRMTRQIYGIGKELHFVSDTGEKCKLLFWDNHGAIIRSKEIPSGNVLKYYMDFSDESIEVDVKKVAYFPEKQYLNLRFLTSQKTPGSIKLIEKMNRMGWTPRTLT